MLLKRDRGGQQLEEMRESFSASVSRRITEEACRIGNPSGNRMSWDGTTLTIVGDIVGGTIDGATIYAGSGDERTLNSSGITFPAGTGGNNQVKWNDGSEIHSYADNIGINSDASVQITSAGESYNFGSTFTTMSGADLGQSANRWASLYLSNDITMNGVIYQNPPNTGADENPLVYDSSTGAFGEKTNGDSTEYACGTGSYLNTLTLDSGIVTASGCSAEPIPTMADLTDLRRELAELRLLVLSLLPERKDLR